MWKCKIDGGDTLQAGYPELHIGKSASDVQLQVHGNIRHLGDDTLRVLGGGLQFHLRESGTICIQSLDDGIPTVFTWVGILLDNEMHIASKAILQTRFQEYGPVVTLSACRDGDTLSLDIVGGSFRIQVIDHDILDIVIVRSAQVLSELG